MRNSDAPRGEPADPALSARSPGTKVVTAKFSDMANTEVSSTPKRCRISAYNAFWIGTTMHWRRRCWRSCGPGGNCMTMLVIAPSELNWVAPVARISFQKFVAEKRGDNATAASAHSAAQHEYQSALA